MVNKSDSKGKITSVRFTDEQYKRIKKAADISEDGNVSKWILKVCEMQLDHGVAVNATPSERQRLANILLYDEGIMDIIYQKIAEKLRLSDIMRELDDFAVFGVPPKSDLETNLRVLAAKMHFLVDSPFHEGELSTGDWVECDIVWEADWTIEQYLQVRNNELGKYHFFHLETRDPGNSDRGKGVYFWTHGDDNDLVINHILKNCVDEGECIHILAGNIEPDNDAALKAMGEDGFYRHIVEMVRYVARDNNIGEYGELKDQERINYHITQKKRYAHGLPYEFWFGWMSDDISSGKTEKEEEDPSLRPEIEARWHYTSMEEKNSSVGETPFTRRAVPENIRYGRYHDEIGKKQSHVPVEFEEIPCEGRKDREGYPKTGNKEVKK